MFKIAGSEILIPSAFGLARSSEKFSWDCKFLTSKLFEDQLTRLYWTDGAGPSALISSKFMLKLFIYVLLFSLSKELFKLLLFDDLDGTRGDRAFFFGCIEMNVLTLFRVRSFSLTMELFRLFSCVLLCRGGRSSPPLLILLYRKILLLLLFLRIDLGNRFLVIPFIS